MALKQTAGQNSKNSYGKTSPAVTGHKDMKKTNEVIKEHSEFAKLIRSVRKNLDKESFIEVYNHGIGGGYGNFIYYSDTVSFWRKNKQQIILLMEEVADSIGENILEMAQGFGCLGKDYELSEIAKCLYGNYSEKNRVHIYNAFAWFAAEEVIRWFFEEN